MPTIYDKWLLENENRIADMSIRDILKCFYYYLISEGKIKET